MPTKIATDFSERFRACCDAQPNIPHINQGEGRLKYLVKALKVQGVIVTIQSVSRWHNGVLIPRDKNLVPLAKALGVTPEYLRFGADHKPSSDHNIPTVTHRFRLRSDFEVELELPIDLSEHEANRLSRFMQTVCLT